MKREFSFDCTSCGESYLMTAGSIPYLLVESDALETMEHKVQKEAVKELASDNTRKTRFIFKITVPDSFPLFYL
ncbi:MULTISPECIES: hypothetical protein [Paenibacillus]|uniref:hypothetical protein n=1 Tax=Paenibacillus TaxID=44249 RepID=UPI0012DB57C8|nr:MULTISPECIES: hypothetical protein [Paenibacillus]